MGGSVESPSECNEEGDGSRVGRIGKVPRRV